MNLMKPGGVVVKHCGLWTRRREFESPPGYHPSLCEDKTILDAKRIAPKRVANAILFDLVSQKPLALRPMVSSLVRNFLGYGFT